MTEKGRLIGVTGADNKIERDQIGTYLQIRPATFRSDERAVQGEIDIRDGKEWDDTDSGRWEGGVREARIMSGP